MTKVNVKDYQDKINAIEVQLKNLQMQSGIKVTHSKDNTNTGGMSGSDMMVLNKIPHIEVNFIL